MSLPIVVDIKTELDALKANDIRLLVLKIDLRHIIAQLKMKCINFRKRVDLVSYRVPSFLLNKIFKM